MNNGEMVLGISQVVSSLILGGIAIMYSRRVYMIEKKRDKLKREEIKLRISKEGYQLAISYQNLPVPVIRILPHIRESSLNKEYDQFISESRKLIERKNYEDEIETLFFNIFKEKAKEVEKEHAEIVREIGRKYRSLENDLTNFVLDIKHLDIEEKELDKLSDNLFKFLRMQPSLKWSAPVLIAYFHTVYHEIAESIFEISNYISSYTEKT